MKRFVYGLIDPLTREMRYVGATTVGMKRPRSHLRRGNFDGPGRHREFHLYRWIRSVVDSGALPEIVVIEYARGSEDPFQLEVGWISYFREIGCRLTNETLGGEGRVGHSASAETRKKLSERVFSTEARRRMSESAKKRFASGMPTEMKAKISVSNSLRRLSQETKDKIAEGQKKSHASGNRRKKVRTE